MSCSVKRSKLHFCQLSDFVEYGTVGSNIRCLSTELAYQSHLSFLSQKLCHFTSQCFIVSTALHCSLPSKFLCVQLFWVITNSVQCLWGARVFITYMLWIYDSEVTDSDFNQHVLIQELCGGNIGSVNLVVAIDTTDDVEIILNGVRVVITSVRSQGKPILKRENLYETVRC